MIELLFILLLFFIVYLTTIPCYPCKIEPFNVGCVKYFGQQSNTQHGHTISNNCQFYKQYFNHINVDENKSLSEYSILKSSKKINKNDILFVIDMQYDFCHPDGNFYVKEGEQIVESLKELATDWNGSNVIFSIDYHPPDHCSFDDCEDGKTTLCRNSKYNRCSGPFPAHCWWSSGGAKLFLQIPENKKFIYVHKGFMNEYDSFGAVPYSFNGCSRVYDCGLISKNTGGYLLNDTNNGTQNNPSDNDMRQFQSFIQNDNNKSKYLSITDKLKTIKKVGDIYVTGLAGDYCVLDTATNLRNIFPTNNIYYVINYTRVAWIKNSPPPPSPPPSPPPPPPIRLQYNNGFFLTDPMNLKSKLDKHGIKLCILDTECQNYQ